MKNESNIEKPQSKTVGRALATRRMVFVSFVSLVTKSSPMAQFSIDYEEIEDDDDDEGGGGGGNDHDPEQKKKNHTPLKSMK